MGCQRTHSGTRSIPRPPSPFPGELCAARTPALLGGQGRPPTPPGFYGTEGRRPAIFKQPQAGRLQPSTELRSDSTGPEGVATVGQTDSCWCPRVHARVRHEALIRDKPNTAAHQRPFSPGAGLGRHLTGSLNKCLLLPPLPKNGQTKLVAHLRHGFHAADGQPVFGSG